MSLGRYHGDINTHLWSAEIWIMNPLCDHLVLTVARQQFVSLGAFPLHSFFCISSSRKERINCESVESHLVKAGL